MFESNTVIITIIFWAKRVYNIIIEFILSAVN